MLDKLEEGSPEDWEVELFLLHADYTHALAVTMGLSHALLDARLASSHQQDRDGFALMVRLGGDISMISIRFHRVVGKMVYHLCCNGVNMITSKHMFRGAILLWMVCATNGCGSHPTPMNTPRDIQRAPNNTERIRIGLLAIDYYPLLSKFNRLRDADFFTLAGTGANNEKLLAFSKLKLDNLEGISLLNCPAVTDVGIHHLSAIESLRHIQLEGTGITDKAIDVIVSDMQLTGINVANCSNVTFQGLRKLASYEPLLEFGFSADNLKQKEVELLISELRSVKWLIIVDSKGNLKVPDLELAAKGKNISLNVSRTGALQDVKN